MLRFRGSVITSDAVLLAYRELDDTLGLTITMPSGCAGIRQCVGWSAVGHQWVRLPRLARGPLRAGLADPAGKPATLADLPVRRIDNVHGRRPLRIVVLDMDSSESPTYGEQEGSIEPIAHCIYLVDTD